MNIMNISVTSEKLERGYVLTRTVPWDIMHQQEAYETLETAIRRAIAELNSENKIQTEVIIIQRAGKIHETKT